MQYQCKQSPSMGMIDDIKKTYEVQKISNFYWKNYLTKFYWTAAADGCGVTGAGQRGAGAGDEAPAVPPHHQQDGRQGGARDI